MVSRVTKESNLSLQDNKETESKQIPSSFAVPILSDGQLQELHDFLTRNGYLESLELTQPSGNGQEQKLPEALAALNSLFSLGERVARERIEALVSRASLNGWLACGLLREENGALRSLFQVQFYDGFFFFADHMPLNHPADLVLPIGPSGKFLAAFTLRRPVKTALDLGCGCGIQALLLSRHAERVTATDINPRALALSRLNARINAVGNIEFLQGSYFEPVQDRKFDLIVANLPYVITPEKKYIYRDTGDQLDAPVRENLQQIPLYLNEGGFGHVMLNWLHREAEACWQPLENWLTRRNIDSWLLYQNSMTPDKYADVWILVDKKERPQEFAQVKNEWLAWYASQGIERIANGAITLRRRTAGDNWRCSIRAGNFQDMELGQQMLGLFENQDYLASVKTPQELLDRRLVRANLTLESISDEISLASTQAGYLIQEKITPATAQTIAFLDGKSTLSKAIQKYASKNRQSAASIEETVVREFYRLMNLGMIKPVT
jgi:methylase of polypeptide subunit release factors